MALKLIEDNEKSFKVQRDDGKVIHIAKTPQTEPIYKLCKGGAIPMSTGGEVPGKAQVKGDSPKNDTVDAKLSPGEMVIPREVVAKGAEAIAKFVADAMAGKHPPRVEKDKKIHAADGEYQLTQQDQDAAYAKYMLDKGFTSDQVVAAMKASQSPGGLEANAGSIPNSAQAPGPTPPPVPPQEEAPPVSGASPPPPGPEVAPAPTPDASATPAALPPGVNQGPTVAEANVPGNGATPEQPQGPTTNTGFDPYKPVVSQSTTDSSTTHAKGEAALGDFVDKSIPDNYKAQLDAGTQLQKNIAERAKAEANQMGEYNQQMAAVNADRNKEINSRLDQLKQVTNKFLGMSIDSNHLYGDSGTGSRIMAGIGLMMGAVGQGLSGKESPVPGIIERNIDRDINIQKANIEKAGKNVEMLSGGLKEYMSATNDMQTAMAAEKSRMLEQVGKQFEATAAANSSPIVKAQAMQNAMMFKEKATQLAMDVQSNVHSDVTQSMMPHLEAQNAEQVTKVQDNIAGKVRSQKLMDILDAGVFDQTGPIKGRIAILKNKFGFSDEDANSFLRNNAQISDQIVHDMAGAKGMQPAEFQSLKGLGPDITSNPKAFRKALQEYHDHAVSENNMVAQSNAENRRYPMDLRAMEDAYVKGTPSLFANKVAFTPQGGHKPKRGK